MSTKIIYKGWKDVETIQLKEILHYLQDAKKHRKALLLVNNTGMGKSHVSKLFYKTIPDHTYVITVGYSYKLIDVLNELCKLLGVQLLEAKAHVQNVRIKLEAIAAKLHDIRRKGGKPVIILDEAENLLPAVLKMIKELYDAIIRDCSIVLIGTEQILDSILNRKNKNRQSVPQLWRRFKAGTKYIIPLNKARDFKAFFEMHIPQLPDLQDLLLELCDNYGELHDYLHPVLCYCAEKQTAISVKLFCRYHNIAEPKSNDQQKMKRA